MLTPSEMLAAFCDTQAELGNFKAFTSTVQTMADVANAANCMKMMLASFPEKVKELDELVANIHKEARCSELEARNKELEARVRFLEAELAKRDAKAKPVVEAVKPKETAAPKPAAEVIKPTETAAPKPAAEPVKPKTSQHTPEVKKSIEFFAGRCATLPSTKKTDAAVKTTPTAAEIIAAPPKDSASAKGKSSATESLLKLTKPASVVKPSPASDAETTDGEEVEVVDPKAPKKKEPKYRTEQEKKDAHNARRREANRKRKAAETARATAATPSASDNDDESTAGASKRRTITPYTFGPDDE